MAEREVERRLAAIVAADVVGYSRLMEADESGTMVQLKALLKELIEPKIAEYRGRIVKTTGDGIFLWLLVSCGQALADCDLEQFAGR